MFQNKNVGNKLSRPCINGCAKESRGSGVQFFSIPHFIVITSALILNFPFKYEFYVSKRKKYLLKIICKFLGKADSRIYKRFRLIGHFCF